MTALDLSQYKQVRIKRALDRYNEDGSYNSKPLDPDYFNKYYHTHKEPTQCKFCCKIFTCKPGLSKHFKRSNVCMRIRAALEREENPES